MKQYFLFLILLASSFYMASAQSLRFYQIDQLSDYEQALEMAIDRNRMIFAVIYKDNGGFEEMVREGVFDNDSLRQAYSKTITMAIQQNSSMAMRLRESFGDYPLPIFYYLTPGELLTHLLNGNQTAPELIRALSTAEANQLEFDSLRTKYSDEGLSKAEWLRLIGFAEMNFDFERTQSLALEFFATLPSKELLNEEVLPVVISYGLNLETPYPHMVIEQRQTLEDTVYNTFYESAYSYNLDLAIANSDSLLLQEIIKKLIPGSPEPDSLQASLILESKKLFAAETDLFSTWQHAAIQFADTITPDSARAEFIFDEAYEIADNYNSTNAQKAARALAKKAYILRSQFRYKMLEAYMAYLMEDFNQAEDLVNTALAQAEVPANVQKAENLKRMIEEDKEKTGK